MMNLFSLRREMGENRYVMHDKGKAEHKSRGSSGTKIRTWGKGNRSHEMRSVRTLKRTLFQRAYIAGVEDLPLNSQDHLFRHHGNSGKNTFTRF